MRQQINAHIQRNTLLETRLLSTLDTLDDVRATSTEEMHILERENARLVRKCEAYERAARDSEKEKADLQGAVLQLVAKGEYRLVCRVSITFCQRVTQCLTSVLAIMLFYKSSPVMITASGELQEYS